MYFRLLSKRGNSGVTIIEDYYIFCEDWLSLSFLPLDMRLLIFFCFNYWSYIINFWIIDDLKISSVSYSSIISLSSYIEIDYSVFILGINPGGSLD